MTVYTPEVREAKRVASAKRHTLASARRAEREATVAAQWREVGETIDAKYLPPLRRMFRSIRRQIEATA
jgi:hypothetical protein